VSGAAGGSARRGRCTVDVIETEGDRDVLANLQRKARQADEMFSNLVREMNEVLHLQRSRAFTTEERIPSWL
jgi:hypothetical protein